MLFNLLTDDAAIEKMTNVTFWLSIGALVLIVAVVVILCFAARKMNTRSIVFAGITIALSFCLSYIKVTPVTYGGSVTLASMIPVMIYAYFYGFGPGLLCGVCHGLLQFIQSPYVLTPVTFILDYLLAFASIAIVPLFKFIKNKPVSLLVGITAAYAARFLFHFVSGIIYYNLGAIWVDLPTDTAFIYSFLYQCVYLIPDWIIAAVVGIILSVTGVVDILGKQALKGLNKKEKTETTEN